jgi:hypothetical protein
LSDFLLWQGAFSYLQFLPSLWPQYSWKDMFVSVLNYQRNRYLSADQPKSRAIPVPNGQPQERQKCERILSFFNYRKETTEKYITSLSSQKT